MEPLSSYRWILTWFFVFSVNENISKWKKFASISFCLFLLTANVIGVMISVAYFLKFVSVDLESVLSTISQITATGSLAYGIILLLVKRHDIIMNFENLSRIFNKYKDDESIRFLDQTNIKCERLWNYFFKYALKGYVTCLCMMIAISMLVSWLIRGELDQNHLCRPFKTILPWNQQTLNGYFAEAFFNILSGIAYMLPDGIFLTLFISHCLHHSAFNKMFRYFMRNFNDSGKSRNNKKFLRNLIEFHLITKEWFSVSASIFSPFILIQLIGSMVILSSAIFHLDMQFRNINFEIYICFITLITGFSNLFVYCYFGKLATESFKDMSDCLYEAKWIEIPTELQKYFIIMIQNTQKPLYYHGFDVAVLNLETFCAMLRAVISYYMMFKTLTE